MDQFIEFEEEIDKLFGTGQNLDDWSMFLAQETEIGGLKLKYLNS